jgi:hypothetical protein
MTSDPGHDDPIHVIRIRLQDRPGAPVRTVRALCRESTAEHLIRDAAGDEVTDLGVVDLQPAGDWPRGKLAILKDKP